MSDIKWELNSPNSKGSVIVYFHDNGFYIDYLKSSKVVLSLRRVSFDNGFEEISNFKEERNTIDESYSLPAGKSNVYHNLCNELVISFSEHDGISSLCVHAFDDGYAYKIKSAKTSVDKENLDVFFPSGYRNSFLQDWIDTYEHPFPAGRIENNKRYGMPCLFEINDEAWILLSEAGIINNRGRYCSSSYIGQDDYLSIAFAPEENGSIQNRDGVTTPWRFFTVVDDLKGLFDSRMSFNLNPKNELEDLSWVHPSRNLWSWWSFENGAELFTEQMKYIDFAAFCGFEGVTVDAGWDDTWVHELCKYAKKRGVDVWIWSDMESLNTYDKAKALIDKWASWGVVGLKIDFFMNDSSVRMEQYDHIARLMIEKKLLINFHGNTKAAGESRTWPCLLTEEGIMGLEHYKWSDMPNAEHNCTVPFTRNIVGSMDYTPTGFSNINRNTTEAHQLALSLVFESGVLHIAESIHVLRSWIGTDFLRRLKPSYNSSSLIYGYPGKDIAVLREKDDEYFIAGITVKAEEIELDLSFLPEGEFFAELYTNCDNGDNISKKEMLVHSTDILKLQLQDADGFALYIAKDKKPLAEGIKDGYMGEILYSSLINDNSISISNKELKGIHIVNLYYCAKKHTSVDIAGICYELEPSGSESVNRVFDFPFDFDKKDLTISSTECVLNRIEILKKTEPKHIYFDAISANFDSSLTLLDNKCIRGANLAYPITFDIDSIEREGKYIFAFDYALGENRRATIRVNGKEYDSVFFNTGGWVEGNWSIIGRKELLLPLNKGSNKIEFLAREGDAPDLKGIEVWLYDKN